jgi:hypothetical protein
VAVPFGEPPLLPTSIKNDLSFRMNPPKGGGMRNRLLFKPTVDKKAEKFVLSKTNYTFAVGLDIKMKAIYTYWRWWLTKFHLIM